MRWRLQIVVLVALATMSSLITAQDKYTNENRPYQFGFKIPGEQHREESKDESGIIMGEFGFVTGDGIYHVTVFATDKDGNYKILSMKNVRVGPSPWGKKTDVPATTTTTTTTTTVRPQVDNSFVLDGKPGCSGCLIPTPPPPGSPPRPPLKVPNYSSKFPLGVRPSGNPFPSSPTGASKPNSPSTNLLSPPGGKPAFPQYPPQGQKPGFPASQNPFTAQKPGFPQGQNPPQGQKPAFPQDQKPSFPQPGNTFPSQNPFLQKPNPASGFPKPSPGLSGSNFPGSGRPVQGSNQATEGLPAGVTVEDVMGLLYKFNYTVGFHGHQESGYRNGNKEGEYYTHFRDGTARKVTYVADGAGYRPKVTIVKLSRDDTPREETEKEYGLKGYEFKWFNRR